MFMCKLLFHQTPDNTLLPRLPVDLVISHRYDKLSSFPELGRLNSRDGYVGKLSCKSLQPISWWVPVDVIHRHYYDVIMNAMASQITSLSIVYSSVYSGADQRKHQSYASLASVRGIHQWPVNSPHKWQVTRKMFPFDDDIMFYPYGEVNNTPSFIQIKAWRRIGEPIMTYVTNAYMRLSASIFQTICIDLNGMMGYPSNRTRNCHQGNMLDCSVYSCLSS